MRPPYGSRLFFLVFPAGCGCNTAPRGKDLGNTLEKTLRENLTSFSTLNEPKRLIISSVPLNSDTSWVQSSVISSIQARRCANALLLRSNCKSFHKRCQSQRWRLEETVTHPGGWALFSLKADFLSSRPQFSAGAALRTQHLYIHSDKVSYFRQISAWSWSFSSSFPASSSITGKVRTSCLIPVIDERKQTLLSDKYSLKHFTDGKKLRLCWYLIVSLNIMWMTK